MDDKVSINTTPTHDVSNASDTKEVIKDEDKEIALTREMVAETLYEMAGKPDVSGLKTRFTDVTPGAWYEDAILWGEKNSICMGYPDVSSDTFGVGKWITRQDMTFMLMRYAEYKNYKRAIDFGRTDEFADYYEIDYYAWEALTWAVTWNFMSIKGDPNAPKSEQRLDPQGKATRAEFVYMIRGMLSVNGASIDTIPIPDKSVLDIVEEKEEEEVIEEKTEETEIKEVIEEPEEPIEEPKTEKNKNKLIIPVLLIIGLVIAVATAIIQYRFRDKKTAKENNISIGEKTEPDKAEDEIVDNSNS